MKLKYVNSSEYIVLDIDRKTKTLLVTHSKTNHEPKKMEWVYLFDKGKEEIQEKVTDSLSNEWFIKAISMSMNAAGFKLEQCYQ